MKYLALIISFLVCCTSFSQNCNHDLNGNGVVDGGDLLELLSVYGSICSEGLAFTPIISEIHYNPASEQGPDSEWEFIELYNHH